MHDPAAIAARDVLTSATPLEMTWRGVHPRLFLDAAGFDRLRRGDLYPAEQTVVDSLLAAADNALTRPRPDSPDLDSDPRGYGSTLPTLAFAWQIRQNDVYLKALASWFDAYAQWPDWGTDLIYGHTAHGFATALDWAWPALDADRRDGYIETLTRNVTVHFEEWRSCRSGIAYGYNANHAIVQLSGLMAAGCALYGEREPVAPWLNMALEKLRCAMQALGPDGVSPESVGYGAYLVHYLLRCLLHARRLLGVDLLRDSPWLRRYARGLIHHSLPRDHWDRCNTFMMFGDNDGWHWYGPDAACRVLAGDYGDGYAQWLADAVQQRGVAETVTERVITLGAGDPALPARPPDDLPRSRRFEDQDIVMMRSDWSGRELVAGFCCGPAMGHSGFERYRQPMAGGHMHAFAGTFQIFAHGSRVIAPAGYARKWTRYFNTLLVDDQGQRSEGTAWFECLPYRQGCPTPRILQYHELGFGVDMLGDATPAYPEERGLVKFHRRLIYLRPNIWIVVDTIETARPAALSLLFHTGFPLTADGVGRFSGRDANAGLCIQTLGPDAVRGVVSVQPILYADNKPTHDLDLLTLTHEGDAGSNRFVTVLEVVPAGEDFTAEAQADAEDETLRIMLPAGELVINGNAVLTCRRRGTVSAVELKQRQ